MNYLILGAGRMGFGAAFDLIHNAGAEGVTIADVDPSRAQDAAAIIGTERIRPAAIDVNDTERVLELMRQHDAVISCVVYHHNERLARLAIAAPVHFCDLGGNNDVVEAELALDEEARAAGVNIVPDCGLAPGMVAVLAAHGIDRFDTVESVHIRVGGLPQIPKPPLDYQIVFSVEGLINEYVEPARVLREGRIVTVASMTEIESLEFPQPFGMMEAFQTSGGTSTLPATYLGRLRNLDYKTIRYPGHCEKFKTLIDLGLASSEPVVIDGADVTPRRLLGELITRHLPADEPDVVLVRLEFAGDMGGRAHVLRYQIIDRADEVSGLSAMMRTTAFPASIVAQMMALGETFSKGALPQERCIPPGPFVKALHARQIRVEEFLTEGSSRPSC